MKLCQKNLLLLGAIRKSSSKVRLIHDASRPVGAALNDYAESEGSLSFQTINDAKDLLTHGAYVAKIDLKSAYRSVGIHPACFQATGLKWKFEGDGEVTYMIDKCLPFGAKFSPGIFHRLTQAVRRMMCRRGFRVVVYLDDFLIVEKSYSRCLEAQHVLIELLRELGFSIAWEKVEGPAQRITFLGVEIDTIRDLLVLPEKKLSEFESLVNDMLQRQRVCLKQLQSLAGKLNWASSVVRGGRIYLRRILDMMKPLRRSHHKLRISKGMRADLEWWSTFLRIFNGKSVLSYVNRTHYVYVDACNVGGACFYNGDWKYINWKVDYPGLANVHINVKEAMMVVVAAQKWGRFWADDDVIVRCDNKTATSAFNKGSTKSQSVMVLVREVFMHSMVFNFALKCFYLPGVSNYLADGLSRLHEYDRLCAVAVWFDWNSDCFRALWCFELVLHMSYNTFLTLVSKVLRWLRFGSDGLRQQEI